MIIDLSMFAVQWSQPFKVDLALTALTGLIVYVVLFQVSRLVIRNLQVELPLVVLNCSRKPVLILITLLGLRLSLAQLETSENIIWATRLVNATAILTLTYWIAQLFTQVAIFGLKRYARRTEAVWDDVLVPILERLVPVLTYLLGAFFFLQSLGIDITGIWVAFGGITFVLGFALKDILGNFFSGLVLLIDTPFQFDDIITLDDGAIAVIKTIGLRVTHLYMIDSDCDVYMPNAVLGNKTIVNLTRPTPHFAATIDVKVPVTVDQAEAATLIRKAVLSHPDTLGDLSQKLACLEDFQGLSGSQDPVHYKQTAQIRLQAEHIVNQHLIQFEQGLDQLSQKIDVLEIGGLEEDESQAILVDFEKLLKQVGFSIATATPTFWSGTQLDIDLNDDPHRSLITAIRHWYQAWQQDPNLAAEDQSILATEWETKLEQLQFKLSKLHTKMAKPGSDETRLDDYTRTIQDWLRSNFKESSVLWKGPKVRLKDIYASTMEFTVKFHADHIKLERWDRGYRVTDEVRTEIMRQLQQAGVYAS